MTDKIPTTQLAANAVQLVSDEAPEWVQYLPAGPKIKGRDGRIWSVNNLDTLVKIFNEDGVPLPVDWEHSSELRASAGLDAPAAGWINQLENRGGELWGKTDWTELAAQQIKNRNYRFISPVFTYDKKTNRIIALISAGLTNQPNLKMTALNRANGEKMNVDKTILSALNLSEDADTDAVVTAVNLLKADAEKSLNRANNPDLAKFVPRTDYDVALNRASEAEKKLADLEQEAADKEIDALITDALNRRIISPATQDFYRATCKLGGVDSFKDFCNKAAPIIDDVDIDKPVGNAQAKELTLTAFNALAPKERLLFCRSGGKVSS